MASGKFLKPEQGFIVAAGTATFTNATNNIALTGVGSGVEVGDVISITGSVSNNKEFTVESITDANNIIVNAAHAGGSTSKSLVNETVAVTVTLLCKWYLAPIGLGQGWANVTASRASGANYTAPQNRAIQVSARPHYGSNLGIYITVDGMIIDNRSVGSANGATVGTQAIVPGGRVYSVTLITATMQAWFELR